jgi:hypothetical protein
LKIERENMEVDVTKLKDEEQRPNSIKKLKLINQNQIKRE